MFPNSPEKIVSFEVVRNSCHEYPGEQGERMVSLTKEHIFVLDSKGMLWARNVDETGWTCLNPSQIKSGDQ